MTVDRYRDRKPQRAATIANYQISLALACVGSLAVSLLAAMVHL